MYLNQQLLTIHFDLETDGGVCQGALGVEGVLPLLLWVHSLQQQTGMVPKNKRGIQSDSLTGLNSDSLHASLSTTSAELKREVGPSLSKQFHKINQKQN